MAFNVRPTLMTMGINAKTLNAIDLLKRDGAAHYTPLNAIDLFSLIKSFWKS